MRNDPGCAGGSRRRSDKTAIRKYIGDVRGRAKLWRRGADNRAPRRASAYGLPDACRCMKRGSLRARRGVVMRLININFIERGMRLGEPVFGPTGQMLLAKGVELTPRYLERLRLIGVPAVYIQDADTSDVVVPCPITPEARARVLNNLTRAFDQVSRSADVIRAASSALLRQEITSERFASAITSTGVGDALGTTGQDVELMINQLSRQEV